jgi:hypothetical protein
MTKYSIVSISPGELVRAVLVPVQLRGFLQVEPKASPLSAPSELDQGGRLQKVFGVNS